MDDRKALTFPLTVEMGREIANLNVGDQILISGKIFCGRDAVLPQICKLAEQHCMEREKIFLQGSCIFHTAVSPAGVGPTSSNKAEIEASIPVLSAAGVKLHLGKGAISPATVRALDECGCVYAVIPPVTALLTENMSSKRIVAFEELGMEAFYEVEIHDYPAIIAAAKGKSIYQ